ncbi:MAG: ATP-binding protein [Bacteroidetes bacterium]|nr:ATP-binding protein [Bacteroidota bacterium]
MNIFPVDAQWIDLVFQDNDYLIFYNNKPLLSPAGNEIRSRNQRILKQLIIESCLTHTITDERFCVFSLQSVITDLLGPGDDPFLKQFDKLSLADPFISLRKGIITASEISKGSNLHTLPEQDPVLFNMVFWGISGALEAFSLFTIDYREKILSGKIIDDWDGFLKNIYTSLSEPKKAVINLLSFTHNAGVVLPFLLACGYINGMEYVNGLSSVYLRGKQPTGDSPFKVPVAETGLSGFLLAVPQLLGDALSATGFLDCSKNEGSKGLSGIIGRGEGHDLEFKSTLRWDLKAGKTNQQVERACLKTISAFLNSNGGLLLIGVRDDGNVEGIESDRFPSTDKFLLHLWTLIRTSFGTDVSPNIKTDLEPADGKTVCVVKCSRSGRPVFLRQPGFAEEFYIRVGPGTIALAVSEALKYISDHFQEKQS